METDAVTSRRMSRTRSRDNALERQLRKALYKQGIRFRIHYSGISGTRRTIDIALIGRRVALFLDGCFWHGCPLHGTWPKRNSAFWHAKITRNISRDRDTDRRLTGEGWRVLRIWEHQTLEEAITAVGTMLDAGSARISGASGERMHL